MWTPRRSGCSGSAVTRRLGGTLFLAGGAKGFLIPAPNWSRGDGGEPGRGLLDKGGASFTQRDEQTHGPTELGFGVGGTSLRVPPGGRTPGAPRGAPTPQGLAGALGPGLKALQLPVQPQSRIGSRRKRVFGLKSAFFLSAEPLRDKQGSSPGGTGRERIFLGTRPGEGWGGAGSILRAP